MSDIYKTAPSGNCFLNFVFDVKIFVKLGDWWQGVVEKAHHLKAICLNLKSTSMRFRLPDLFANLRLTEERAEEGTDSRIW